MIAKIQKLWAPKIAIVLTENKKPLQTKAVAVIK